VPGLPREQGRAPVVIDLSSFDCTLVMRHLQARACWHYSTAGAACGGLAAMRSGSIQRCAGGFDV